MKETEGSSAHVPWYLLAAQRLGSTPGKVNDPVGERAKRIADFLDKTQQLVEKAPKTDLSKVAFRKCRIRCRDVIELYSDEGDPRIKDSVTAAQAMLEKLPKAGGD